MPSGTPTPAPMATEGSVEVFLGVRDVASAVLLGDVAKSAIPDGDVVVLSADVVLLIWYTERRGKAKGSPTGLRKVSLQQLSFPWPMQQNEFPHSPTGMQDTMLQ